MLWAALPVGVMHSMAYSGSLFTALAVWCLHSVLRGPWLMASLLPCAAGLTGPLGVAAVVAVMGTAVSPWLGRTRSAGSAESSRASGPRLAKRNPLAVGAVLAGCTLAAATYAPIWLLGPGPP